MRTASGKQSAFNLTVFAFTRLPEWQGERNGHSHENARQVGGVSFHDHHGHDHLHTNGHSHENARQVGGVSFRHPTSRRLPQVDRLEGRDATAAAVEELQNLAVDGPGARRTEHI